MQKTVWSIPIMQLYICLWVLLCGSLHCFKYIILKNQHRKLRYANSAIPHDFWIDFLRNTNLSHSTDFFKTDGCWTQLVNFRSSNLPDVCQNMQEWTNPPSDFTTSKTSAWLWIIGIVTRCCDTIGVVLFILVTFCRAHTYVLWRSKLRNTYCTLNFARDCFRISS